VPDRIAELLLTEAAIDKLGARRISVEEVHQLVRNANVTVWEATPPERRLLRA
jgi:hypothetical protein